MTAFCSLEAFFLEALVTLDGQVLLWIQQYLRIDGLNPVMAALGSLGNAGLCWIVLGLVLALIPKTRKYGILALGSLLICFLFNNLLLKNLFARPRPGTQLAHLVVLARVPSDWSFPSGHACSSFACAGGLWWSMGKRWNGIRIPALVLAVLIAWSRLYVGVHYPTDVLVGAGIGLLGSWAVTRFCSAPYDRLAARLRRTP